MPLLLTEHFVAIVGSWYFHEIQGEEIGYRQWITVKLIRGRSSAFIA